MHAQKLLINFLLVVASGLSIYAPIAEAAISEEPGASLLKGFTAAPVVWKSCPFLSRKFVKMLKKARKERREAKGEEPQTPCADIIVPFDWTQPQRSKISLRVYKIPADKREPFRGSMWFINGGPGEDAKGLLSVLLPNFEKLMKTLGLEIPTRPEAFAGYDVYFADHRGTGESTPLTCTNDEAVNQALAGFKWDKKAVEQCLKELAQKYPGGIEQFSVTNATFDYGFLMSSLSDLKGEIVLQGFSYGTYLSYRILELFPSLPKKIIMHSPVGAPGTWDLNKPFWSFSQGFSAIFKVCAQDPVCAAQFPEKEAGIQRILQKLTDGGCKIETRASQALVSLFIKSTAQPSLIPLMMGVLKRLDRCSENDVKALDAFFGKQEIPMGERNYLIYFNIAESELSFPQEDLPKKYRGWASTPLRKFSEALLNPPAEVWPRYTPRPHQKITFKGQGLIITGELDLVTTQDDAKSYQKVIGGDTTLLVFPLSGHSPTYLSACGGNIVKSFLQKGKADTACLSELAQQKRIDFSLEANKETAQVVFKSDSLWGP